MAEFCAGIVTYNPEINRLEESINSLKKQIDKIFLVDNHSDNIADIKKLVLFFNGIDIIENDENYGIAKALNQMCAKANEGSYQWILTLDQDTVIPDGMIEEYSKFIIFDSQIGILCPAVYYEGWDKEKKGVKDTDYVYACMTSASLTNIDAWKHVGGFREEYFIDFVDNEFCMKLKIHNYKIMRVNKCKINHQLGETGGGKIFGLFGYRYIKHSTLRLYYMVRNNYVFIMEYREHLNYIKEMLKLFYIISTSVLYADKKIESLQYIKDGIKDAKARKLGEFCQ